MTSSTLERVVKIIVQATGLSSEEQLGENTPLVGSGISLDSSAVLELLVALEKEFRTEISADELLQAQALTTVGTLAEFIRTKVDAPA